VAAGVRAAMVENTSTGTALDASEFLPYAGPRQIHIKCGEVGLAFAPG
jgi:hypothetical protein